MDVVVNGRHCTVTERFRKQIEDKIARLERYSSKIVRVKVELSRERNPRLSGQSERVEITVLSRGPAVRAEAAAEDRFAALDLALDKLLARMRKAADRRRVHHGSRTPISVAEATAGLDPTLSNGAVAEPDPAGAGDHDIREQKTSVTGIEVLGEGPLVVREKTHRAVPLTLEQALYEMELVGHDFFLFIDADTKQPSVVYRRRGYDYGVIHLEE